MSEDKANTLGFKFVSVIIAVAVVAIACFAIARPSSLTADSVFLIVGAVTGYVIGRLAADCLFSPTPYAGWRRTVWALIPWPFIFVGFGLARLAEVALGFAK